jgi:hypothetical protein
LGRFGVPGGFEQLQFYLQSVSINGWIGAFISEPRATVISLQWVFCWSEGDFETGIRHRRWPQHKWVVAANPRAPVGADNIG